jgi:hypothetical protein
VNSVAGVESQPGELASAINRATGRLPAGLKAALPRAAATLRSEHGQFSQAGKKAIRTLGAWVRWQRPYGVNGWRVCAV